MFQALEGRVAEIKARFTPKKTAESKTFSLVQQNRNVTGNKGKAVM